MGPVRRWSSGLGSLTVFLATLALGGCSLWAIQGPPPNHAELTAFTCTEDRGPAVMDLIWGGLALGATAVVLASDSEGDFLDYEAPAAATFGTMGLIGMLSAKTGFDRTTRCRDARRALEERLSPGPVRPDTADSR